MDKKKGSKTKLKAEKLRPTDGQSRGAAPKEPNPSQPRANDQSAADQTQHEDGLPSSRTDFSIVGIGASAGGLEAFTQFLNALPADTGMAIILVQHLSPRHQSALPELLAGSTRMPVIQVTEGLEIEPNHVYVMPP